MKLFLDTADLNSIKDAVSRGIISGVTTNPSLMKKAVIALKEEGVDIDIEGYIKKILASAGRLCPVSLEVVGLTADEMFEQGMLLYEKFNTVAGNVVIKIPVSTVNGKGEGDPFDGIMAISRLSDERIPINATLIFTPEQALLAAKAGAEYVSPFAGRIDDLIRTAAKLPFDKNAYFPSEGIYDEASGIPASDHGLVSGMDLVEQIVVIFKEFYIECEVIAASIRNQIQVRECALSGAHIATVPFNILEAMVTHPGTRDGIDSFTADLVPEYTDLFKT